MKTEIKLGDKVKCKITGFVGIATARTEFLNGCIQYMVTGKVGKDNKMVLDDAQIDEQSLEVVKPKRKKKIKKESNGGLTRIAFKQRGY